ncbi:hypothetical protein C0991_008012 [Blastosporella zonata]|nr:hypothetical protein C0991_008012 [Blastosporella zonata]
MLHFIVNSVLSSSSLAPPLAPVINTAPSFSTPPSSAPNAPPPANNASSTFSVTTPHDDDRVKSSRAVKHPALAPLATDDDDRLQSDRAAKRPALAPLSADNEVRLQPVPGPRPMAFKSSRLRAARRGKENNVPMDMEDDYIEDIEMDDVDGRDDYRCEAGLDPSEEDELVALFQTLSLSPPDIDMDPPTPAPNAPQVTTSSNHATGMWQTSPAAPTMVELCASYSRWWKFLEGGWRCQPPPSLRQFYMTSGTWTSPPTAELDEIGSGRKRKLLDVDSRKTKRRRLNQPPSASGRPLSHPGKRLNDYLQTTIDSELWNDLMTRADIYDIALRLFFSP